MSNQEQIHGHEVMQMINDAVDPIDKKQLQQQIQALYGDDPKFFACAIQDADFEGILTFLKARGKVVELNGKLSTEIGLMCDHG